MAAALLAAALLVASSGRASAEDAEPSGASPGTSSSDVEEAKVRFKAGKDLYDKGDYTKALTEFQAGYLLTRNPAFLINIGLCHKRLGQKEEALENFRSFLEQDPKSSRRAEVEAHIRELGPAEVKKPAGPADPPPTDDPAYVAPVVASAPKPTAAPATKPAAPARGPVPAAPRNYAAAGVSADQGDQADDEPLLTTSRSAGGSRSRPAVSVRRRAVPQDEEEGSEGGDPFYKKGWFWGVVGAVVLGTAAAVVLAGGSSDVERGSIGTIDARGQ